MEDRGSKDELPPRTHPKLEHYSVPKFVKRYELVELKSNLVH